MQLPIGAGQSSRSLTEVKKEGGRGKEGRGKEGRRAEAEGRRAEEKGRSPGWSSGEPNLSTPVPVPSLPLVQEPSAAELQRWAEQTLPGLGQLERRPTSATFVRASSKRCRLYDNISRNMSSKEIKESTYLKFLKYLDHF